MACRLFIDEVGNDDINHPNERYLSLTGIITKLRGCDNRITPEIEALKAEFFGHAPPDKIVVLHRKELVRREAPFEALRDDARRAEWEARVLEVLDKLPYLAITVLIDKHEHRDRYGVWHFNPYHYCMTALLERYVLWLNSHRLTGDVVVEPRHKGVDKPLKKSFQYFYNNGTDTISARVVQKCLRSKELKFDAKSANSCGLQVVELIAHPCHHGTRCKSTGDEMTASFGKQIYALMEAKKFRRNPNNDQIVGWGQKWLP